MADSILTCPNCMHLVPPLNPTLVSSDILGTNDPPIESQIPFLRDFVSRGRARTTALNAKIAFLQSILDNLRQERDELDVEIGKHEGALSPLRRMPTEISSFIFTLTLPPYQQDAESAPWTISAVCVRWRAIVISQPCFWTSIRYNSSHPKPTTSFRLETQLRRSRELPLNIKFITEDTLFIPLTARRLDVLCQHAERWQRTSISGPEQLYRHLEGSIPHQLSFLRELTIELEYNPWSDIPSLDMFNNAPLLQGAVVNQSWRTGPLAPVLPWSQLLRYNGSSTWDDHLYRFRSATNLVDCSLVICG